MRKIAEYFGQTARNRTDIQSTIMKEYPKVIARLIKVNTVDADIDNMLLGKQLSEWVSQTSKLLENMGQAYNVILGQSTAFTRLKIKRPKG